MNRPADTRKTAGGNGTDMGSDKKNRPDTQDRDDFFDEEREEERAENREEKKQPSGIVSFLSGNSSYKEFNARRKFLVNFAFFVVLFGLSILIVRYALPALVAFFIAYVVVLILNPVARFFRKKLHMERKVVSVILVLLFYATIGLAVVAMVVGIVNWLTAFIKTLPDLFSNNIVPGLYAAADRIDDFLSRFNQNADIGFDTALSNFLSSITSAVADFSKNVISKTPALAAGLSGVLFKVVICIISTFFMLADYDVIRNFFHRQLSEKTSTRIKTVMQHLGKVLKKYILSYLLIMVITFAEIFIGLLIIGTDRPALIAALIAVFDILPIVGSGLVLLPWAIVTLILGKIGQGIGLLILWAVVVVIRQVIEPKIVGSHVGMHPLLTLFAMIAGNFIYGGIGILLLPVSLALIQSLNEEGIIHIYTPLKNEDYPEDDRGRIAKIIAKPVDRIGDRLSDARERRREKRRAKKAEKEKEKMEKNGANDSGLSSAGMNDPILNDQDEGGEAGAGDGGEKEEKND